MRRLNAHPARLGAATTAALHAFVLAGLLIYEPTRSAFVTAAPIMVDWISATKPEPVTEPPRPKPVVKQIPKPVEPPPLITTAPELPATLLVPAVSAPEPEPEPVVAAPVAAPVVAVTPPIFDAAYLDNPAPAYPLPSRKSGEQGRVILRVLVNPAGRADSVEVRSSSGYWRLDDAASETVRSWKFVPAKHGADAVPAWVLIPVSFRLES
jgi:protein TonB